MAHDSLTRKSIHVETACDAFMPKKVWMFARVVSLRARLLGLSAHVSLSVGASDEDETAEGVHI